MLEIRLMGPPVVEVDGTTIQVDTRKAIALLAYVAVEGETSRDVLSTLLWGDSSTERARATLRRTLSSLRTGAGSTAVTADRNLIGLGAEARSDLDDLTTELKATEGHGHASSGVCEACIPHLTKVMELYRGDFLEGFSVRDAPDFEDWARSVAERLRLQVSDALDRLAMALAGRGEYTGAISVVRRWIDLDELHEPAHRLLMLLHAWAGDRPGAVAAYRDFVAVVDRELGVAPLEETTELYEAILDEDLPPAPGVRRRIKMEPSASAEKSAHLLDRDSEMAVIREAWSGAPGGVVVIRGAPWMGKTRILEEVAHQITDDNGLVLLAKGSLSEQGLPYGIVTQILRAARPLFEGLPEWVVVEISRLIPGGRGVPTDMLDRFAELRMLEALYEAIVALTKSAPLLIAVDDAHWVDQASATFLSYLGRRAGESRTTLFLAMRQGEPVPEPLTELTKIAEILDLRPLTPEDLHHEVTDPEEATRIIAATGGVPLLVMESLQDRERETATSVSRYIEYRSQDLSDLARQVLATAAVIDGIGDAQLLREVSGRSDLEVVEAIEELVAADLMREQGGSVNLTLDALRTMTYESLTIARRRLLHRRAAEALAARPRSEQDLRIAATVAHQFREAGDGRAGNWYQRAGDLARAVYANEDAARFYGMAVGLGGSNVAEIRLALGELAMARGDYSTALTELTIASSAADDEVRSLIEHRLGELHRLLGRFEMADEHYARAVVGHPQPATVYADWAMLHLRLGHGDAARSAARQSLDLAGDDKLAQARAENVSGVVAEDREEAMAHFDSAIELAADNEPALMAALNNKAHALASAGDLDSAVPLVERAIEIADATGYRHREAALRNHLADLHHRAGRASDSTHEQTLSVSLFAGVDAGDWEPEVWLLSRW